MDNLPKTVSNSAPPAATSSPVSDDLTNGMELFVHALKKNNLDTIFGVVGIPVTDMARYAQKAGIRYIGFRHEQSAGNAAAIAGYLTKKPGILLTVSAPGFLNGITALANATQNGFPMIQISGSSTRSIIDLEQGDYEGLDQMNIAKPFAKAAYRIDKPEDIATGLARAIRAAVSGRPGGVYLDLTTALLETAMDKTAGEASLYEVIDPAPEVIPSGTSVDKALSLLQTAQKPLLIIGKGAAYAQADTDIQNFVKQTGIPFLPMSMAKGLLPDDNPQSVAAARSFAMENADVVMLLGARLNWMLSHGKGKHWPQTGKLIQVDIEPTEIDSNRKIDAPIVGDIVSVMGMLLAGLKTHSVKTPQTWLDALNKAKQININKMAAKMEPNPIPMHFYNALGAVKKVLDKNKDIYLVNEGANTLDNTRDIIDMYYPRRRLDCGTWGVMGIGMGFAIGAAITTGKQVVAICGDSAFGFSGMEIATICRYKLPVTILVFNNGGIYNGYEANWGGGSDPSPTTLDAAARYDKLIEAFAGDAFNATTPDEIEQALTAGLQSKKPTLINCVLDIHAGVESGHIGNLNPKMLDEK